MSWLCAEKDGSAMLEIPLSGLERLNGRRRQMPQSLPEMDGSSIRKSRTATQTIPPMMQPTMSMRFDDGMLRLTASSLPEVLAGLELELAVDAGSAVVDSRTMPGPCRGGVASGEIAVAVTESADFPVRVAGGLEDGEDSAGVEDGAKIVGEGGTCVNIICSTSSIGASFESPSAALLSTFEVSKDPNIVNISVSALGDNSASFRGVGSGSGAAVASPSSDTGMVRAVARLNRVKTIHSRSLREENREINMRKSRRITKVFK